MFALLSNYELKVEPAIIEFYNTQDSEDLQSFIKDATRKRDGNVDGYTTCRGLRDRRQRENHAGNATWYTVDSGERALACSRGNFANPRDTKRNVVTSGPLSCGGGSRFTLGVGAGTENHDCRIAGVARTGGSREDGKTTEGEREEEREGGRKRDIVDGVRMKGREKETEWIMIQSTLAATTLLESISDGRNEGENGAEKKRETKRDGEIE